MTTGAIIPALNAARHLPGLLDELRRRQPELRLLVVDDGSADDTAAVARAHGAEVVRHEVNRGKGAALATGFAHAVARGWEWALTLDADGQHLPSEVAAFLAAAAAGGHDVLVGSRMAAPAGMPWIRRATNRFTSAVVSRLAGQRIPDSQCGYRIFRVAPLAGLRLRTARYDTESEILVRLARRGCRIGAVPVTSVYGEERSSIRPLRDTARFFRLVALLLRDRSDGTAAP
jgi:glycosyltransferase involved in cell wall biosynthesis